MKLWKSKKSNNNNNNVGHSGSGSTISCVPGKTSSLNKGSDAKVDTATNSSTTVSGKSPNSVFKLPNARRTKNSNNNGNAFRHLTFLCSNNSIKAINRAAPGVNSGRIIFRVYENKLLTCRSFVFSRS